MLLAFTGLGSATEIVERPIRATHRKAGPRMGRPCPKDETHPRTTAKYCGVCRARMHKP